MAERGRERAMATEMARETGKEIALGRAMGPRTAMVMRMASSSASAARALGRRGETRGVAPPGPKAASYEARKVTRL
jgi:hypothetical protein